MTAVIWLLIGLFRHQPPSGKRQPMVSVLIAARNEEGVIGKCLTALSKQDYPPERWELIVVDDDSEDATRAEVRRFREKFHKMKMLSIEDTPRGVAPKKHALSMGIRAASGAIILTTDADCLPPSGWITSMANQFDSDTDAVAGFSPLKGNGLIGAIAALDALINAVVSAGSIGQRRPATVAGRNFAFRRSVFLEIGGYGENIEGASGDDDLLLQRIGNHGGKVRFNPDVAAHVLSSAPLSIDAWWRMKRRHISAGKRYEPVLVAFSSMLYLFQIGLILSVILTLAGMVTPQQLLLMWGVKILVDGVTVAKAASILKVRRWLFPLIVAELISPLVFSLLIPTAMIGKVRWKGRELDS
jgi:cellulose synthase/poly-beta-1,6-N-acetylglucosamine synthase-like glycosyltransferase